MSESDETLAIRVQQGDKEAYSTLVKRYEEKITRYARRFLRVAEDREDIVQEVFLKAFINIKSFDPNRKFSPWLYRIAHNEFVNALKKGVRQPFQMFDFDTFLPHLTAKETADGDAEKFEIKKEMEACLSELEAKYREPLVLYFFEELSYESIAEVLHIPVSTVGVRISRAKHKLRVAYTKKFGPTV